MAEEDENHRIDALRQELLRKVGDKHTEMERILGDVKSDVRLIKWLLGFLIVLFGFILALLTAAANIL